MPTVLHVPSFTNYKNRFLTRILGENVLYVCRVLQGSNTENNTIRDACVLMVPYYKTSRVPENEFTSILYCTNISNREYDTASYDLICLVFQE